MRFDLKPVSMSTGGGWRTQDGARLGLGPRPDKRRPETGNRAGGSPREAAAVATAEAATCGGRDTAGPGRHNHVERREAEPDASAQEC